MFHAWEGLVFLVQASFVGGCVPTVVQIAISGFSTNPLAK